MARPVKIRTANGYAREIEQLGRLRTSILLDSDVDEKDRIKVLEQIDEVITSLRPYAKPSK